MGAGDFFPGDDDADSTPPIGVPRLKPQDWARIQAQADRVMALNEQVRRQEREITGLRAEVYDRGQRIERLQAEGRRLRDAMVRWRDRAAQLELRIKDLVGR